MRGLPDAAPGPATGAAAPLLKPAPRPLPERRGSRETRARAAASSPTAATGDDTPRAAAPAVTAAATTAATTAGSPLGAVAFPPAAGGRGAGVPVPAAWSAVAEVAAEKVLPLWPAPPPPPPAGFLLLGVGAVPHTPASVPLPAASPPTPPAARRRRSLACRFRCERLGVNRAASSRMTRCWQHVTPLTDLYTYVPDRR